MTREKKLMEIGDYIIFKAATRCDYRKAKRKIVGFDPLGRVEVRYAGWSNFIVLPHEIISVEKTDAA